MIWTIFKWVAIVFIVLMIIGFIGDANDKRKAKKDGTSEEVKPVKKEALVPKEAHEEITPELLDKYMEDRWDRDIAEAEAEISQRTAVKEDSPVITQEGPEAPSEQAEMAEDNPDAVILNPEDTGYHDYWMSHERAVLGFLPDYTVIDIETTGFDRFRDKIVEISAIRVRNHEIVERFDGFNKNSKLSKFLKDNSAITQEGIDNGQSIEDLLRGFKDFVGDDMLVGHNIGFDLTFLRYNLHYYEFGDFTNGFVDTMLIGKYYANLDWRNHRVTDYIRRYPAKVGGQDNMNQHTALNDVIFEYRIYELEREKLGDDFIAEIDDRMKWTLPKVRVVEEDREITIRVNEKKMDYAIRIAIDDKDYQRSNEMIEELFEAGITDHSKLYKRMAMNYKKMGNDNSVLSTIVKWQSNMGGNIGKGDTKWIQNQLERINQGIILNK